MTYIDTPADLTMPIGEAMFTQRAIRRLRHDKPIDDADLKTILDAASKAPNGGNTQPARFLVIRDRDAIQAFGKLYHEAWWAKRRDDYGWKGKADIPEGSVYAMPALLADEMVDAPAVVLAFTVGRLDDASSVFPAVQNLLLAARALGIGSVLTTLHADVMDRVYEMFDVPADAGFHCCIPLGYPRGNFGPTRRLPTSETTSWNKWGAPPPWK
ncbi:MAG: nitroreductase family protein [Gammaproteobacteria bacterium]|nr:nitroreductase family protein [Gammaproteobacteria bacterium]